MQQKTKCSDVSIFKGKARNVDYMSSCKLRVLERFPCINTSGLERQNGCCEHAVHNSRFRGTATASVHGFGSDLFHRGVYLAQTEALHRRLLYISMN